MAITMTMKISPFPTSISSSSSSTLILHPHSRTRFFGLSRKPLKSWRQFSVSASSSSSPSSAALQALIFDCDGVILESEHLHRQAYNDAFAHFNVRCSSSPQPLNWASDFYDELQNLIGGGKPKMRWYFKEHGWPSSTVFESPLENNEDREKLIDIL